MPRSLDSGAARADLVSATKRLAELAASNPTPGAAPFAAALPAVRFEYWQQRLLEISAELERTQELKSVRLVFLGDSITDFWSLGDSPWFPGQVCGRALWDESFGEHAGPNRALNLGISGDRTEHVLHRILPRSQGGLGELDAPELDPDFVLLMIGINNAWGGEEPLVDSVFAGILAIVALVHSLKPRATVIVQSLLPMNESAKNREVVAPVNDRLAEFARQVPASAYVRYLDLCPAFLDARGSLIDAYYVDGLHPNEAGYRIWRDRLVSSIATLRAEGGVP